MNLNIKLNKLICISEDKDIYISQFYRADIDPVNIKYVIGLLDELKL